jgi:hypothetical protein
MIQKQFCGKFRDFQTKLSANRQKTNHAKSGALDFHLPLLPEFWYSIRKLAGGRTARAISGKASHAIPEFMIIVLV